MTSTTARPGTQAANGVRASLGALPPHWQTRRLKYVALVRPSGVDKHVREDEQPVRLCNYTDVYNRSVITDDIEFMEGSASSAEIARFTLRRGDVLITKDSETWDDIAVAAFVAQDLDGVVCGYHLALLRPIPEAVDGLFLAYSLSGAAVVTQFYVRATGIIRYGLSHDDIKSALLPIPPLQEQRAIAAFLDRETARIDALIAKRQRLIELLEEKRSALITNFVTKGLDPNVPMKDSGVDWLGEIPAHWEILPLKRRADRIETGRTPPTSETRYYDDGTLPWFGPGSFGETLLLDEPVKFVSEAAVRDGVVQVFESGSVMIVTIGATIGKVGYADFPASANQQITAVSFDKTRVFPKYGAYQLKSFERVLKGIAPNTTLPILAQDEIGYLPFAVPPSSEQHAITRLLDGETAKIDALLSKVREHLARLRELRTALISTAVTGQIDVRGQAQ